LVKLPAPVWMAALMIVVLPVALATVRLPVPVMDGVPASEPFTVRVPVLLFVQVWVPARMMFALMVSAPARTIPVIAGLGVRLLMPPAPMVSVFVVLPLSPMVTLLVDVLATPLVKFRLSTEVAAVRLFVVSCNAVGVPV
jgi:hypothetical protein